MSLPPVALKREAMRRIMLAGSRLYTSAADTDEVIDDALPRCSAALPESAASTSFCSRPHSTSPAACGGLTLGLYPDFTDIAKSIRTVRTHAPDPAHRDAYERNYRIFKRLYPANRKNFALANGEQ